MVGPVHSAGSNPTSSSTATPPTTTTTSTTAGGAAGTSGTGSGSAPHLGDSTPAFRGAYSVQVVRPNGRLSPYRPGSHQPPEARSADVRPRVPLPTGITRAKLEAPTPRPGSPVFQASTGGERPVSPGTSPVGGIATGGGMGSGAYGGFGPATPRRSRAPSFEAPGSGTGSTRPTTPEPQPGPVTMRRRDGRIGPLAPGRLTNLEDLFLPPGDPGARRASSDGSRTPYSSAASSCADSDVGSIDSLFDELEQASASGGPRFRPERSPSPTPVDHAGIIAGLLDQAEARGPTPDPFASYDPRLESLQITHVPSPDSRPGDIEPPITAHTAPRTGGRGHTPGDYDPTGSRRGSQAGPVEQPYTSAYTAPRTGGRGRYPGGDYDRRPDPTHRPPYDPYSGATGPRAGFPTPRAGGPTEDVSYVPTGPLGGNADYYTGLDGVSYCRSDNLRHDGSYYFLAEDGLYHPVANAGLPGTPPPIVNPNRVIDPRVSGAYSRELSADRYPQGAEGGFERHHGGGPEGWHDQAPPPGRGRGPGGPEQGPRGFGVQGGGPREQPAPGRGFGVQGGGPREQPAPGRGFGVQGGGPRGPQRPDRGFRPIAPPRGHGPGSHQDPSIQEDIYEEMPGPGSRPGRYEGPHDRGVGVGESGRPGGPQGRPGAPPPIPPPAYDGANGYEMQPIPRDRHGDEPEYVGGASSWSPYEEGGGFGPDSRGSGYGPDGAHGRRRGADGVDNRRFDDDGGDGNSVHAVDASRNPDLYADELGGYMDEAAVADRDAHEAAAEERSRTGLSPLAKFGIVMATLASAGVLAGIIFAMVRIASGLDVEGIPEVTPPPPPPSGDEGNPDADPLTSGTSGDGGSGPGLYGIDNDHAGNGSDVNHADKDRP